MGACVRHALHRSVPSLCSVPNLLWLVARQRSGQLSAVVRRSSVPFSASQHTHLLVGCGESEAILGTLVVGVLHAQGLVDQDLAADLHPTLGRASHPGLHLDPLDAEWAMGS